MLEVFLIYAVITIAMSVLYVVFPSAEAAQNAQWDMQNLVPMTIQSPAENAYQAVENGPRSEWLREVAARGKAFM